MHCNFNTWNDPYIAPSSQFDWTNGTFKINLDTSPANWRAYSRHSGVNPFSSTGTSATTPVATTAATSATTPTVGAGTNPAQEVQPYFDFGDVSVANEAKRRRAAAIQGTQQKQASSTNTSYMEDENGRQYTIINGNYVPVNTGYMEDENGRQYTVVNGNYTPIRKKGGVLKVQQGAQIPTKNSNTPALDAIMNNPQLAEQFLSVLSQQLGKEITLEDLTTAAANPETGAQLEQLAQQMMKQSAKQGAKLEYVSRLRGKCPEGQELVYFAKGGKVCSACMGKKLENGGEPGYMKSFRDRQRKKQMEKCGGKMKKGK